MSRQTQQTTSSIVRGSNGALIVGLDSSKGARAHDRGHVILMEKRSVSGAAAGMGCFIFYALGTHRYTVPALRVTVVWIYRISTSAQVYLTLRVGVY